MHLRFSVALAGIVVLGLVGCAATNVTPEPLGANPAAQAVASGLVRPVQATNNLGPLGAMHRGAPALRVNPDASYKRALYIADDNNNNIKILSNTYYRELGEISNGISGPVSETMDQLGNLYVANEKGGDVTEYAPGGTSPSFTYNANMSHPSAVQVDRQGNVYELEVGSVNKYYQGTNVVSQSCSVTFGESMAVDANGDVFVGTIYGIYEFANGLSGCNSTLLNSQLYEDQAMVTDANNDLIVSEGEGEVAVIAPPYTSVTRTIGSGFYFGEGLSINKKNKLVYVASVNNDSLIIINYQTGQNVKVLSGGALGISRLYAVVDGPNFVP